MTRHSATSASGSTQPVPEGARLIGACDPAERFEVVLLLRRHEQAAFDTLVGRLAKGDRSAQPVSRAEYEQRFGAAQADIERVSQFAAAHGLTVVRTDPLSCRVTLSGTVAQHQLAFGVELQHFEHGAGAQLARFRRPAGPVKLPADLREVIGAVLGLDTHAKARPYFRLAGPAASRPRTAAAPQSFSPLQVAAFYDFPAGDGSGQCVALLEFGGGYQAADLQAYFAALGVPAPQVEAVSVDAATNAPTGDANGPDGEVALDIEIVGALVPAARIAVYFAPNTEAGFVDALSTALHDTVRQPAVVSISWGGPESTWSQEALTAFNQTLQSAVALGITVCVASGDNGSADGVKRGDHVDFPASSPYVLGCGGTHITASGASLTSETVWGGTPNDGASGGGVSAKFALPAWQQGLSAVRNAARPTPLAMRGVPDVAGDADPDSGYAVRIDGTDTVVGGTSAVAPLWAALITRINAARGKPAGFVNPLLYGQPAAFHDVVQGSNGDFDAAVGWDACTGLGTPIGSRIAAALGAA